MSGECLWPFCFCGIGECREYPLASRVPAEPAPRKTNDELVQIRNEAMFKVPVPSMWVHNKSGKQYFVTTAPTLRESDLAPLIHYHASLEPFTWTRSVDEFLSAFTRKRIEEPFNVFVSK